MNCHHKQLISYFENFRNKKYRVKVLCLRLAGNVFPEFDKEFGPNGDFHTRHIFDFDSIHAVLITLKVFTIFTLL
jgi:hypothetical protein